MRRIQTPPAQVSDRFLSIMSKLCRRNVPHDDIKALPLPLLSNQYMIVS